MWIIGVLEPVADSDPLKVLSTVLVFSRREKKSMGQLLKEKILISYKICLIYVFILDATSHPTERLYFLLLRHFLLKFSFNCCANTLRQTSKSVFWTSWLLQAIRVEKYLFCHISGFGLIDKSSQVSAKCLFKLSKLEVKCFILSKINTLQRAPFDSSCKYSKPSIYFYENDWLMRV